MALKQKCVYEVFDVDKGVEKNVIEKTSWLELGIEVNKEFETGTHIFDSQLG